MRQIQAFYLFREDKNAVNFQETFSGSYSLFFETQLKLIEEWIFFFPNAILKLETIFSLLVNYYIS